MTSAVLMLVFRRLDKPREAEACGVTRPGVVDGLAPYFYPEDHHVCDMRMHHLDALENRRRAVDAGFARSREFSWEASARRDAELYRRVAAQ